MHVLDDLDDPIAVERVIQGRADIYTLPHRWHGTSARGGPEWRAVFTALRQRPISLREAASLAGVSDSTVHRWHRRLDAPPPPDGRTPLTAEQRRAVLDVVHGRTPLKSLPEVHRWIAVHACRAEGLTRVETAARVRANHATVAAYVGDPGEGVAL